MVDENKFKKIFNIIKIIGIIIIIILIIYSLIYFIFKNANTNNLKAYLLNNGYKIAENNSYSKFNTTTIDNVTTTITYLYSLNANKFTKEIKTRQEYNNNTYNLLYNGTDTIRIYSSGEDYINNKYCTIVQSATYNMKNKEFKCEIESIEGNHSTQCGEIKNYAKEFAKEINLILKESHVNNLFTTKNSNKW